MVRAQEGERHIDRARLDGLDRPRRGNLRVSHIAPCPTHRARHVVVVSEDPVRATIDADEAYPPDNLVEPLGLCELCFR